MRSRHFALVFALITATSSAAYFVGGSTAQQAPVVDNEYQVGATLYMQKAAEYRALAYQAYNIARWQLDADLAGKNKREIPKSERKKPRAVVVDIDETVLDNSPAQAYNIRNKAGFDLKGWYAWGDMKKAKPIPGAVDFLNYAVSKGVKVFFISNRDDVPQKQATIENLTLAGFRDVSSENVLLRVKDAAGKNVSTKTPRRDQISEKYRIVLLMGDNLDDFSDIFEPKHTIAQRFLETDNSRSYWGKRWIVLPNAMYGTWENAIYEHNQSNMTSDQRKEKRLAALELP